MRLLILSRILIVLSFHSLEDRIVKYFFNLYSNLKRNTSRYLPQVKSKSDLFKVEIKKPLVPQTEEIDNNPRSRSAKLRYAIRNNNTFFFPTEFKKKFEHYFKIEEILS